MMYICQFFYVLEIVNYYCYYQKTEILPNSLIRVFEHITRLDFGKQIIFWFALCRVDSGLARKAQA